MHGPSRTVTQRTSPSCCCTRHSVGAARSQITVWPQPPIASSIRYSAWIPATRSSYDSTSWQRHAHGYGVFTASTTVAGTIDSLAEREAERHTRHLRAALRGAIDVNHVEQVEVGKRVERADHRRD